jgi:hypothetical protein
MRKAGLLDDMAQPDPTSGRDTAFEGDLKVCSVVSTLSHNEKRSARPAKTERPIRTLMRVNAITAQGWIVCSWSNPATRKNEARMFFPEMLEEVGSSP